MLRQGVKFAGVAGPVVLPAYAAGDETSTHWAFSDAIDCESFLQAVFELYPDTLVGGLYYTLEFCDDEVAPGTANQWLPDPIDGAATVASTDNKITVNRLVRVWTPSATLLNMQVNTPLPHRWVRIGLAAGTSGNCMAIVKRLRLASE